MICDICGAETDTRYGIDILKDVWCCDKCFHIFKKIHSFYSKKGYSRERCIRILRGVVEKQKNKGAWSHEALS